MKFIFDKGFKGWTIRVHKGMGAGYIGGWTLFAVSKGEVTIPKRKKIRFKIGITKNANKVPFVHH